MSSKYSWVLELNIENDDVRLRYYSRLTTFISRSV